MAVLQFQKLSPSDEGRQRHAALLAFSAFSELKHVFIVGKTIFDCTVPYDQKERFVRARFMDVEPEKWVKDAK